MVTPADPNTPGSAPESVATTSPTTPDPMSVPTSGETPPLTPASTAASTPAAAMESALPVWSMPVTPLPRNRWWLYLAACVVLGIVAVVWPLVRRWQAYQNAHPLQAIQVARGAEGEYADARWRLLDTIVEPPAVEGGAGRRALPEGTTLVRARFTVIPGKNTDLQQLQRCRPQVRDRAGRRWSVSGGRFNKLPNNCGSGTGADFKTITATVGQPWTFEVGFVVPENVAREVEPELLLSRQFPRYLHFAH